MKVLGIHIGHDSSAALIVDGCIVADVAEERFNRIKHSCELPVISNFLVILRLLVKLLAISSRPIRFRRPTRICTLVRS